MGCCQGYCHPRGSVTGFPRIPLGKALPGAAPTLVYPWTYAASLQAPEQHSLSTLPHIQTSGAREVLLLTTPGMMDSLYPGGVVNHHLDDPPELYLLSSANAVFALEKLDAQSFELRADRPGWLSNYFARLVRTEELVDGTRTVVMPAFSAHPVEPTADGRDVLAVRFELRRPLSELLMLHWTPAGYQPLLFEELVVGQAVELTDSSDLWASML